MGSSSLVILGIWLGLIGYGVAYAGAMSLKGTPCSIGDAFSNRCGTQPATATSTGGGGVGGPAPGRTLRQHRQQLHQQQLRHLARQPLLVRA